MDVVSMQSNEGGYADDRADRAFRERFLADPAAIGAQQGLSSDECRAVATMPAADLATAARSYEHKRGDVQPQRASWLRRVFRAR